MRPEPWEVQTLRALDDAFLQSRLEATTATAKGAKTLKNRMTGKAARAGEPRGK